MNEEEKKKVEKQEKKEERREKRKHKLGLFKLFFKNQLRKIKNKIDSDGDGKIEVHELLEWIEPIVRELFDDE
jgi:hypothetical protein